MINIEWLTPPSEIVIFLLILTITSKYTDVVKYILVT